MSQPGRIVTMSALFNALWMSINSGRLSAPPFAVMPVFGAGVLPVIVISPFGWPTPGRVHERVVETDAHDIGEILPKNLLQRRIGTRVRQQSVELTSKVPKACGNRLLMIANASDVTGSGALSAVQAAVADGLVKPGRSIRLLVPSTFVGLSLSTPGNRPDHRHHLAVQLRDEQVPALGERFRVRRACQPGDVLVRHVQQQASE